MPAFEGSMTNARGLVSTPSVDIVVIFADGTVGRLPLRTLLAPAPSSHIMAMARIALRPKRPPPADEPDSGTLPERLKRRIAPGLALSTARVHYWSGTEPGTIEWLRTRMQEIYPDRPVKQVRVDWYRDTYTRQAGRWNRDRAPVVSLDVPL
jgi:hypothetical protein